LLFTQPNLIVLNCGESPRHLSVALASIVEQTLQPTEIVLVKDGPLNADLENVIACYVNQYPSFKVIALQKNLGLGEALRIGLDACSYDIVVRMDSDDIACPNRFEIQVPYLYQNNTIAVLGANIEEFELVPGDVGRIKRVPSTLQKIKAYSRFRCPVNHPVAAFRKTAIISAGSYKHMLLFEDYYLWLRLLKQGFIIENLPDNLLYFRVSKEMMKRRHGLNYFRKELYFFKRLRSENLISIVEYITLITTRLPIRLLPQRISLLFYKQFLR
jgi:glycosyltransferase involved in cell wall biosynthesis